MKNVNTYPTAFHQYDYDHTARPTVLAENHQRLASTARIMALRDAFSLSYRPKGATGEQLLAELFHSPEVARPTVQHVAPAVAHVALQAEVSFIAPAPALLPQQYNEALPPQHVLAAYALAA